MADITYLNGSFYSTNYDLSGNSGSQIDLLKFEDDGNRIFLADYFDLDMNGQGYLAITNDSEHLYIQSKQTELLIKSSSIGEKAFLKYDDVSSSWHPAGLAYNPDNDSLNALYRNGDDPTQYRLRTISKDVDGIVSRDKAFRLDFIDNSFHGVYALEYHDNQFYMLGVDSSHQDVMLRTDYDLNVMEIDTLLDSTVVGLCFKGGDLYLSFRENRIEPWAKN